jgi:hypothetical protein
MTELAGGMDFQGAKLTDMKPADKEWYRALRKVHYNFAEFVKANFPKIVTWSGEIDDIESFHEGSMNGAMDMFGEAVSAPSMPVVQPAPQEKKEVPTAGAPAKAVAKPAPKKKEPMMVKKGMIWEFADYNKATIKLEEEQVDPKMTYNFFNCERCVIIIPGKIKGVMLSRCKGSKL